MSKYDIYIELEIRGIKAKNEDEARDIFGDYDLNKSEVMTIDIHETSSRKVAKKPVKKPVKKVCKGCK